MITAIDTNILIDIFRADSKFLNTIQTLGIEYSAIKQETALVATKAWQKYQQFPPTKLKL